MRRTHQIEVGRASLGRITVLLNLRGGMLGELEPRIRDQRGSRTSGPYGRTGKTQRERLCRITSRG